MIPANQSDTDVVPAASYGTTTVLTLHDAFSRDDVLFEYATTIAESLEARLDLFDVQFTPREIAFKTDSRSRTGPAGKPVPELNEAERRMKQICDRLRSQWEDTHYTLTKSATNAKIPKESDYWLEHIKSTNPTVILLREQKERHVLQELIGSDERRLVRRTDTPVLRLPQGLDAFGGFGQIAYLLPREYALDETLDQLDLLANLARTDDGKVLVCYFTDAEAEAAELELGVIRSKILNRLGKEHMRTVDISSFRQSDFGSRINLSAMDMIAYPLDGISGLESQIDFNLRTRIDLANKVPVMTF